MYLTYTFFGLLILLRMTILPLSAQDKSLEIWSEKFGHSKNGIPLELYNQPDAGFLLVSYQFEDPDSSWHLWFTKITPDGKFSWERDLGLFDNDYFNQFFYIPKVGFWLSGSSFFRLYNEKKATLRRRMEMYLARMEQDGSRLWKRGYATDTITYHNKCMINTGDLGFLTAVSVIQDDLKKPKGSYSEMSLIKLNKEGKIQWRKTYGDMDRAPHTVLELKDSRILVMGSEQALGSVINAFWLSAFSAKGELLWTQNIKRMAQEKINKLLVHKDGSYWLMGNTGWQKNGPKKILIIKTDTQGNELWRKYLDSPAGNLEDTDMIITTEGQIFLAAREVISGKGTNEIIFQLDETGKILSQYSWPLNYMQTAKKLLFSTDKQLLIYGSQQNQKENEVWIKKLAIP